MTATIPVESAELGQPVLDVKKPRVYRGRCIIEACTRTLRARGMCTMHYDRWRKHGDPNHGARIVRDPVCLVAGCARPQQGRGYCPMHYTRLRKSGELGPVDSTRAPAGSGSVMANGYRVLHLPEHPLSGAQGKVYEHRAVLYDAIGPGTHPCHWCSTPLRWDGVWPADLDALTVDHLDDDRTNNDPSNLVPACNECNTQRRRRAVA